VSSNQPSYKFDVESAIEPGPSPVPGATVLRSASNTYRDEQLGADRYAEAQAIVFLGRLAPQVQKRADHSFEVAATAEGPASIVVRLRGNETLIADLLRKTNWNSLLELLK
jgi:hypothetical protein